MGARVVGVGGIVAGASLAFVVGDGWRGGCWGCTVGVGAAFRAGAVLTVAGSTGTGAVVVVGLGFDKAVDIAGDVAVAGDVASLGVTVLSTGRARWSNTTAIAAAAASVARTTPASTSRLDQRLSFSGCERISEGASLPSPAGSSASSGSNR
jgi:hypothetical protein